MRIRAKLSAFLAIVFIFSIGNQSFSLLYGASSKDSRIKRVPSRKAKKADVIVEWQDILSEDCDADKVCVTGQLKNQGNLPALGLFLRIELGGTKYIKPRIVLKRKIPQTVMNPGDRQEFYLEINRNIRYKRGDEMKNFEVGKYNFKIKPQWAKKGRVDFQ